MSHISCFELFCGFSYVILDCSGFSAAPADIKLAVIIIIIIQTMTFFQSAGVTLYGTLVVIGKLLTGDYSVVLRYLVLEPVVLRPVVLSRSSPTP